MPHPTFPWSDGRCNSSRRFQMPGACCCRVGWASAVISCDLFKATSNLTWNRVRTVSLDHGLSHGLGQEAYAGTGEPIENTYYARRRNWYTFGGA